MQGKGLSKSQLMPFMATRAGWAHVGTVNPSRKRRAPREDTPSSPPSKWRSRQDCKLSTATQTASLLPITQKNAAARIEIKNSWVWTLRLAIFTCVFSLRKPRNGMRDSKGWRLGHRGLRGYKGRLGGNR